MNKGRLQSSGSETVLDKLLDSAVFGREKGEGRKFDATSFHAILRMFWKDLQSPQLTSQASQQFIQPPMRGWMRWRGG